MSATKETKASLPAGATSALAWYEYRAVATTSAAGSSSKSELSHATIDESSSSLATGGLTGGTSHGKAGRFSPSRLSGRPLGPAQRAGVMVG